MTTEYKISKLEERHILSIMLYLRDNDGCKKIELYHDVSTNPRMPIKLNVLEEMGLIRIDQENKRCNIFLTERGKKVADSIAKIEETI